MIPHMINCLVSSTFTQEQTLDFKRALSIMFVSCNLFNCVLLSCSDYRKMLQSLGRPELHMALEVTIVSGSGQEHAGCLLLTSEVLFVVSLSEDTQQQAFPITEVTV